MRILSESVHIIINMKAYFYDNGCYQIFLFSYGTHLLKSGNLARQGHLLFFSLQMQKLKYKEIAVSIIQTQKPGNEKAIIQIKATTSPKSVLLTKWGKHVIKKHVPSGGGTGLYSGTQEAEAGI